MRAASDPVCLSPAWPGPALVIIYQPHIVPLTVVGLDDFLDSWRSLHRGGSLRVAKEGSMDDFVDPTLLDLDRYAIGQPVPRSEDPVLVSGKGQFTDDVNLAGQAYAVIVRSHYAHGIIRNIDSAAARGMPGVLSVYTAADLEAGGIGPLPPRQVMNNRDGTPMLSPLRYALATGKVRYVGDPIAAVVAETAAEAKDAAEAVFVDIDPLPAVTTAQEAAAPGAPLLYDDVPGNVGLDFHYGDSAKVAAAFAGAAHVTRLQLRNNRIVVNAMEPRAAVAQYDAERQHWTLHVPGQGVFGFRNYIAGVFGVGRDKLRVLTDRVGGSFGMKQPTYAEYYCIMHAARELGRPVKWTDERSGSFLSDSHGRDAEMTAELALERDGHFLAVRLTGYGNLGATYGAPGPPTRNAVRNTLGVYKTPLIEVSTKCMFTNTTPVGAYRGAGRPRPITTWSGWSRPLRPKWISIASNCAGATTFRRRRCRRRARMARPMTAATSPIC